MTPLVELLITAAVAALRAQGGSLESDGASTVESITLRLKLVDPGGDSPAIDTTTTVRRRSVTAHASAADEGSP